MTENPIGGDVSLLETLTGAATLGNLIAVKVGGRVTVAAPTQ